MGHPLLSSLGPPESAPEATLGAQASAVPPSVACLAQFPGAKSDRAICLEQTPALASSWSLARARVLGDTAEHSSAVPVPRDARGDQRRREPSRAEAAASQGGGGRQCDPGAYSHQPSRGQEPILQQLLFKQSCFLRCPPSSSRSPTTQDKAGTPVSFSLSPFFYLPTQGIKHPSQAGHTGLKLPK